MTPKTLSQFQADFVRPGETIEVDALWLQNILRERDDTIRSKSNDNKALQTKMEKLVWKLHCLEVDFKAALEKAPTYKLDIKG